MEVIKAPFPDVLVVSIFALTHTKLPVKLKVAIVVLWSDEYVVPVMSK